MKTAAILFICLFSIGCISSNTDIVQRDRKIVELTISNQYLTKQNKRMKRAMLRLLKDQNSELKLCIESNIRLSEEVSRLQKTRNPLDNIPPGK